jgi:PAS domain S-box-containing protein
MSLFHKTGPKRGKTVATSNPDQAKVIIDGIEDGVILIDNQQTIQTINPAAAKMTGWAAEEASGLNVNSVIGLVNNKGEAIPDGENPLKSVFTTGKSVSTDNYFLLTRNKKQFAVSLRVSPLIDNSQKVYQAVAMFNNISEQRANEQQRADFISTASHEMRTPVAAIEGYLALALNQKVATVDTRARDYLEKAYSSTQHLGKLFQDLLTSARAEDGRLTSNPVVTEMGEFLTQLADELKPVAAKSGLTLELATGNHSNTINAGDDRTGGERVIVPLYYAFFDPIRLREVITNLFDNAVKYTPEGKITIGLTGNPQTVQCFVRDTGPGIQPDDIPHLFQKFYRVDSSATRTIGGNGLGLFICRKIVELYNGRIWVESEIGKGSTFFINLPRLNTKKANEMQKASKTQVPVQPVDLTASVIQ